MNDKKNTAKDANGKPVLPCAFYSREKNRNRHAKNKRTPKPYKSKDSFYHPLNFALKIELKQEKSQKGKKVTGGFEKPSFSPPKVQKPQGRRHGSRYAAVSPTEPIGRRFPSCWLIKLLRSSFNKSFLSAPAQRAAAAVTNALAGDLPQANLLSVKIGTDANFDTCFMSNFSCFVQKAVLVGKNVVLFSKRFQEPVGLVDFFSLQPQKSAINGLLWESVR
ncbi:MAG: hypothetical protein LBH42_08750 [Treponema sp.]|nr:hypothetical protein [Treponema sp.]